MSFGAVCGTESPSVNMNMLHLPCRWVAVNEIRLMASLDPHPNVVNCFEGFLDGDHLCIVMELVPGGELADIIQ